MTEGGDNMDTSPIEFTRKGAVLISSTRVANPMQSGTFFTNMAELTWLTENHDVLVTFGCLKCGEQKLSRPQMSIHVGEHNPDKPKTRGKYKTKKAKQESAVGTVEKMIADLTAERDMYKAQARKHARQLQALRDLFKIEDNL